ncbi:Alpha amylase inhibitor [Streptosporangium subroseum]|uniref:Alpha amylase inhibitor n=1 Tax=Streptosporangium subroseum TaxID=106412 RepID=A0A239PCY0_9ACTN|nr:hypothetical protein [Streptosporangium subroseum]SNT64907.1 Alpha amylase inhibitor [Streptosporangium subroseum]
MAHKRLRRGALFAAGTALAAVATAPVMAAPAAAAAAACVTVATGTSWGVDYVTVRNGCSTTQRVKVIILAGDDSGCTSLAPGKSMTHRHVTGRYQTIQFC